MCDGKKCGLGRYIPQRFLLRLEERGSICQRLVITFDLGSYARMSHTPNPSPEAVSVMPTHSHLKRKQSQKPRKQQYQSISVYIKKIRENK